MEYKKGSIVLKSGTVFDNGDVDPRPCHPSFIPIARGDLTDCEEHRKIARRQYDRYERQPDVGKKYGRAWKRIRDRYVQEHSFCERCFEEGRMTPVEEVHHTGRPAAS